MFETRDENQSTSRIFGRFIGSRWWFLLLVPAWGLFVPLWLAWGLGQYHGDQTATWEPCFHLPAPLVLGGGLLLVTVSRLARARLSLLLAAVLLVWPLGQVLWVDNHWGQPARPASESANAQLRVLHWNVWHGQGGWERVLNLLDRERPDILILSEYGGTNGAQTQDFLSQLGDRLGSWGGPKPEFHLTGSLLVCSHLPIDRVNRITLPSSEGLQVDLRTSNGTPLRLLALDLPSSLRRHRDPLLRQVKDVIVLQQPDLVLGDFNAVRRATQLRMLPAGYRHAYDAVGSGWSYTWPVPLPVLAIDHCMIGPQIQPIEYVLGTGPSDHRWQRLDFCLQPRVGSPSNRVDDFDHD